MSEEQLKQVAGGNCDQTANDSKFPNDYRVVSDWHGEFHQLFNWKSDSAEIDDGWRKAGIISVTSFVNPNKYILNGKPLTRDEAYRHVRENFKRVHNEYYGHTGE